MNTTSMTLRGTVRPDGTLDLETPVSLPPGPVQVIIQAVASPESGPMRHGLLAILDEIQARQKARGYQGRSVEEMEAEEAGRQAEDEDYETRWRKIVGARQLVRASGRPEAAPLGRMGRPIPTRAHQLASA